MLYTLQYSKIEPTILEQALRGAHGGRLPEAIANAPALLSGLELFIDAWHTLSTDRRYAEGVPLPIPWSSIERYCDAYEIRGSQREDVHFHLRAMDVVYLEYAASKRKPPK